MFWRYEPCTINARNIDTGPRSRSMYNGHRLNGNYDRACVSRAGVDRARVVVLMSCATKLKTNSNSNKDLLLNKHYFMTL